MIQQQIKQLDAEISNTVTALEHNPKGEGRFELIKQLTSLLNKQNVLLKEQLKAYKNDGNSN